MDLALRPKLDSPVDDDARARPSDEWVLEARNVSHSFGDFAALGEVSVHAHAGEFVTLLGPSGSGKTTLLRIIVGLERATEVEALRIGGQDMRNVPSNRRNVAMVFQHTAYAHGSGRESLPPDVEVEVRAGERVECSLYVPADGATT